LLRLIRLIRLGRNGFFGRWEGPEIGAAGAVANPSADAAELFAGAPERDGRKASAFCHLFDLAVGEWSGGEGFLEPGFGGGARRLAEEDEAGGGAAKLHLVDARMRVAGSSGSGRR
jgi:hypothetical protein